MSSTNQNGADSSDEHAHQPSARLRKVSIAPHWAAISGLVAIGVLYALLPTKITFGPSWLLLAVEGVFLLPAVIAPLTNRRVSPVTLRVGSLILLGIVTMTLAVGIVHMLGTLRKDLNGFDLLSTGLLLYGSNVLLSALWYWEIDGGGPEQRRQSEHQAADFLFPQQLGGYDGNWNPHFFDYLYVAFTGATAFSPTDTMPLSHRAKFLMMLEAILALILISFIVSRAINII